MQQMIGQAGTMDISLSGQMQDGSHRLTQRVYYEDTDFSGFVYHARYLHFFERGRTDFIRLLGVSQGQLHAQSDPADAVAFVVRRMEIDFKSPARMDDVLTIITRPREVRGARMMLDQEIRREGDLLSSAVVTVAVVNGLRPGAAAAGSADPRNSVLAGSGPKGQAEEDRHMIVSSEDELESLRQIGKICAQHDTGHGKGNGARA
jgi:acyl-CoA thioester hydrolase